MNGIVQPCLAPLVTRLSRRAANEPQALKAFVVTIDSADACLRFEAMAEDSMACTIQHMGLAEQMGGKLKVSAR